jgi:hypothetical protein
VLRCDERSVQLALSSAVAIPLEIEPPGADLAALKCRPYVALQRAGRDRKESQIMRSLFKSGFFWRFVGGFVLGAIGVVALHPSAIAHDLDPPAAAAQSIGG